MVFCFKDFLTYCEKTNSTDREKTFEITKTIFQTVKGQNNFGNRMLGGFSDLIHSNSNKKKIIGL